MNRTLHKLTISCTTLLGVALWCGFATHFDAEEKLNFEPNPGCVKGSPYGKVLALAMQGPIDFYWHQGQTHEHMITLNGQGKHAEDCTDCDHHDHSVQSKPSEHVHGDDCGCPAHDTKPVVVERDEKRPLRTLAKLKIEKMGASAHRKTNGEPLSPAHQKHLQSVIEDKLRLAYDLDPSNYTNYGNLHLFFATTTFGKGEADDEKAIDLAKQTLEFCKRDKVDPSSWLTAASAAYNIVFHIGRYHERFTVAEAKASLAEFDHCMTNFNDLLAASVEQGHIASEERLHELTTRAKYLTKLRTAQGVYMKRMMSNKVAKLQESDSANN